MDQIYKRPDTSEDRFDSDPELSYTIPARLYWDRDVLEEERREIFDRSWIVIAHRSELDAPGAYVTAEILGQRVFAIRTRDLELRAFYNVCQHRGHALLEGRGQAKNVITCPYHAWAYDYDGTLQAARHCEDVKEFDKADFSIPAVRVQEFAGFVFVNLDPDAEPIEDGHPGLEDAVRRFCPGVEDLKPACQIVFDIKGNWKNVGDNLLECYHCTPSHKAFVDLVDMDTYKVTAHGIYSSHMAEAGNSANAAYDVSNATVRTHAVWWIWPTTPGDTSTPYFSGLPGSQATVLMMPVALTSSSNVPSR